MKEDIIKLFNEAILDDLSADIFADNIMLIIKQNNQEILNELLNKQEEIISSPIRFNGCHINNIQSIFKERGINYNTGF